MSGTKKGTKRDLDTRRSGYDSDDEPSDTDDEPEDDSEESGEDDASVDTMEEDGEEDAKEDKALTISEGDWAFKLSKELGGKPIGLAMYGSVEAKQGAKLHLVPEKNISAKPKSGQSKLARLYEGTDQIRTARSYSAERQRQILRWLATAVFAGYGGVEIQCYFDGSVVWISSNKNDVNAALQAGLVGKNVFKQLGADKSIAGAKPKSRQARHVGKLMASEAAPRSPAQAGIADALKKGKVKVPSKKYKDFDLHAERRIGEELGELEPARLAGVKRPCLVCMQALSLSRPGPAWTTNSGLGGRTLEEVLQHAVDSKTITYVTKDRITNKLTINNDTDSDSDTEQRSTKPAAKKKQKSK